jgi:hypothetical protein
MDRRAPIPSMPRAASAVGLLERAYLDPQTRAFLYVEAVVPGQVLTSPRHAPYIPPRLPGATLVVRRCGVDGIVPGRRGRCPQQPR